MNKKFLFLLVLLCLTTLSPIAAYAVDVEVVEHGGGTAWLVEDRHVPVVHLSLLFKDAGSASDPEGKEGRAQMLASMLMEGTQSQNSLRFHQALEEKAISMDVNAGRDAMVLEFQTLSEYADDAVALLAEVMREPAFDAARFHDVKARFISARRRQEESPNFQANRSFSKIAYGDHPYARPSIGDEKSIGAMRIEDLQWLQQKGMALDNVKMAVVGAASPAQVKKWMDILLDSLPKEYELAYVPQKVEVDNGGKWKSVEMDIPQSVVQFGTRGIDRADPLYYAGYVANYIIGGGGLTSRLSDVIRQKNGLTYYIGMDLQNNLYSNAWVGNFASRNDQTKNALTLLDETLAEIAEKGVSEQEVADAISYITGSFPLNIDSSAGILNYLTVMQLYDLGPNYLNERNDLFRAVTTQQVNDFIQTYLDRKRFIIVKVGPKSEPATVQ